MKGQVLYVSRPSLVMTRETDDGLLLSVADPNFGWNWTIQDPHRQNRELITNQPSRPRAMNVTLRGKWRLDGVYDYAMAMVQSDQTVMEFTCQDGKTIEVKLIRIGQ